MSDEEQANEYRAYFTLVGDFDPVEITIALGLQPTPSFTFHKGDPHPRTNQPRPGSRWSLQSRLGPTTYIDLQVTDVLDQLAPVKEEVLKLRSTYDGWVQLVAYFLNGQASISLSAEIINRLSSFNLGVDLDPYDLLSIEEG